MNLPNAGNDFPPCNLCKSRSARYLYPRLNLIKCDECGLVRTDTVPSPDRFRELYSEQYFRSTDSGAFGYDDYIADRSKILRTFEKRMEEIERCIGHTGRLLDVGCAMGFSLEVARNRGWDAHGVEISEFACEYARRDLGIEIICGTLPDTEFEQESFDVVTMWDYIEHSVDPAGELDHASRLLKQGGLLALTTPNISSLPARLWGKKWMGIKEEEHLYYFSPNTIRRLLRSFKLEPIRVEHVGKYIDIDFFIKRTGLYCKGIRRLLEKLSHAIGLGQKQIYINPLDIMLVYARKMSG